MGSVEEQLEFDAMQQRELLLAELESALHVMGRPTRQLTGEHGGSPMFPRRQTLMGRSQARGGRAAAWGAQYFSHDTMHALLGDA